MTKENSLTGIIAIVLMILTFIILGYHLAHFLSKKELRNSEIPTIIVAYNITPQCSSEWSKTVKYRIPCSKNDVAQFL